MKGGTCVSEQTHPSEETRAAMEQMSTSRLEELLLQYRPTLLFVEHDRVFREKIATEVGEL